LSNHETPIDNDLLWAAIDRKRSKNWKGLTIVFLGVLLIGVVGINLSSSSLFDKSSVESLKNENNFTSKLTNDENSINLKTQTLSHSNSVEYSPHNNDRSNTAVTTEQEETETDIQTNKLNSKVYNQEAEQSKLKAAIQFEKNTTTSNSALRNENSASSISKDLENKKTNKNVFDSDNFQDNKTVNEDHVSSSTMKINPASSTSVDYKKNIDKGVLVEGDKITNQQTETSNIADSGLSENVIQENAMKTNRLIQEFKTIPTRNLLEANNKEKLNTIPKRMLTDCPTFGPKSHNIYVQGYSFLDYVGTSYSTGFENSSYLEERKNSQSYMPSYRAGLQGKYLFDNGLYVKAGIELAEVRERFTHRLVDTTVMIQPNQLISYYISSPGDTTFIYGNAPVTTITVKNWNVKNSYQSLDIPILLGYQVKKDQWTYGFEAGVIYNLRLSTKSLLLDPTSTPESVPEYFRDNIDLSLTGGLTVGYAIKPKINLLMLAHFKRNLSPINTSVDLISQKFTHFGLGVGLEFKI
ncbi:MAG: hypothetical protein HKO66_15355, partial [Saprospiraceae bacterium]|nr:hypothetical protein [Saprospiraceae bacterium]